MHVGLSRMEQEADGTIGSIRSEEDRSGLKASSTDEAACHAAVVVMRQAKNSLEAMLREQRRAYTAQYGTSTPVFWKPHKCQ